MMDPSFLPAREARTVVAVSDAATRETIRSLLSEQRDCQLVGEARTGEETLRALRVFQPDILIFDEELAMDAIQLLGECSLQRMPAVVFVGSRRKVPPGADSIARPIDRLAFVSALHRVRIRSSGAAAQPFIVTVARRKLLIQPNDVRWIGAMGYYAVLHAGGRGHLIRQSLDSLSQRLDPSTFVRIHRSAIANVNLIRAMGRAASGETVITLHDGTRLPVSRRRRRTVTSLLRGIRG